MTELDITPVLRDGVRVLILEGEVDACSVDALESALGERHGEPVVADLSVISFIDSSGLHALLKASEAGALAAIVRGPDSNISRVLTVIQANKIVPVFDDLQAAIRHVDRAA